MSGSALKKLGIDVLANQPTKGVLVRLSPQQYLQIKQALQPVSTVLGIQNQAEQVKQQQFKTQADYAQKANEIMGGLLQDPRIVNAAQNPEEASKAIAEGVDLAEKYGIPYNFLPAISVIESSGGREAYNNNPFGWGSAKIRFDNFGEAIEVVGRNLGGGNPNTAIGITKASR